ncbi:MAG: Slp family lipoprotein [Tahibacter sp.]
MLRYAFAPLLVGLFLAAAMTACTTQPVILAATATIADQPHDVAAAPEQYTNREVLWGGMILGVRNLADTTEVTVLAYPLDAAQRPQPRAPTQGRFIAVLPGYVESHDYPDGLFVTLNGRLDGTRVGQVQEHDYVYPLVRAEHVHLWPSGFQFDQPQWHFGIGVGIGIH